MQTKEKDILYKLFDYKSVIISDGVDQMVRKSKKCDWLSNLQEIETTSERRCFRQKNNLVNFLNVYAEEFSLDWNVDPINEHLSGSNYITEIDYDYKLFQK